MRLGDTMSLRYLWNYLEDMDTLSQQAYIENIFQQFNIKPMFPVENLFRNTKGKEALFKNPLGYLIMHLSDLQLTTLLPLYLRQLVPGDTFSKSDKFIMNLTRDMLRPNVKVKLPVSNRDMFDVFSFGVGKYSPWSFLSLDYHTLIPALFRHLYKHFNISKTDEETGLPHLAHAACNIRMIQLIKEKSNNGS